MSCETILLSQHGREGEREGQRGDTTLHIYNGGADKRCEMSPFS